MSSDTKGFVEKAIHPLEIVQILSTKLSCEVQVHQKESEHVECFNLLFECNGERRRLFCWVGFSSSLDKYGTTFILGAYKNSVEIIKSIVEEYGGFIIENDSSDDWEMVHPNQSVLLTKPSKQYQVLSMLCEKMSVEKAQFFHDFLSNKDNAELTKEVLAVMSEAE